MSRILPKVLLLLLLVGVVAAFLLIVGYFGLTFENPGIAAGFSPDSSLIAYTWIEHTEFPTGPESYTVAQKAYIRWCSVSKPNEQQSIEIDSVGTDHDGYQLESLVHMEFSPDARHLAVVSRGQAFCIDLRSARSWRLSPADEVVTSVAWRGIDEIVYAAHGNLRGGFGEIADRTFWRHRVYDPPERRTSIYVESAMETGVEFHLLNWPLESWSPRGRYAIFLTPGIRGQLRLLDIETGEITRFGKRDASWQSVAWNPDGSVAACFISYLETVGARPRDQALLVVPSTGEVFEFSTQLAERLGTDFLMGAAQWTTDGNHLIINPGGHLIRPRPWEFIPVGGKMARQLGPSQHSGEDLYIYPLGKANWVRGLTTISFKEYAFNYVDNQLVEIGDAAFLFVTSPDASLAARIDNHGRVTIVEMNLRSMDTIQDD